MKKHLAKRVLRTGQKLQISISLSVEVIAEIRRRAEADHRSLSNFVEQHCLLPWLEEQSRQEQPGDQTSPV